MRDVAAYHVARVITLGMMAGPRIGPSGCSNCAGKTSIWTRESSACLTPGKAHARNPA